jgi:hypothetical protein
LEGGPPGFRPRFTGAVLLRNTSGRPHVFAYGTIAPYGARFHVLRLTHDFVTPAGPGTARKRSPATPGRQRVPAYTCQVWADPFSLATTQGVSVDFHSSRYLDVSVPSVPFLRLCIQRRMAPHYRRRVFPFGDPRVNGCSAPHRGFSQPSTSFFGSWCQGIHRVPLLS